MSSATIHPKPEDATSKPKVTVATVLPNAHRIKTDKEEGGRDETDDVVTKPRPSPAMLRRTLTKVKEVDSDDEHHLQPEIADKEDGLGKSAKSSQTEVADKEEPLEKSVKSNETKDEPGMIVPLDAHGQIVERGKKKKLPVALSEEESADHPGHYDHRTHRGGWVIRKDDEFFHFIVMCFAFGALLVTYHNYADWTMSAGIGLITFASLETIGIYFGFVTRIRAVIEGFLPLFQRSAIPGLSKEK